MCLWVCLRACACVSMHACMCACACALARMHNVCICICIRIYPFMKIQCFIFQVKELGIAMYGCSCSVKDVGKIFETNWMLADESKIPYRWPKKYQTQYNKGLIWKYFVIVLNDIFCILNILRSLESKLFFPIPIRLFDLITSVEVCIQ